MGVVTTNRRCCKLYLLHMGLMQRASVVGSICIPCYNYTHTHIYRILPAIDLFLIWNLPQQSGKRQKHTVDKLLMHHKTHIQDQTFIDRQYCPSMAVKLMCPISVSASLHK